jgi:hypothetical protein
MKKYFLEIIVFLDGTAVMIFELIGGKVLARFLSIFLPQLKGKKENSCGQSMPPTNKFSPRFMFSLI